MIEGDEIFDDFLRLLLIFQSRTLALTNLVRWNDDLHMLNLIRHRRSSFREVLWEILFVILFHKTINVFPCGR